MRGASRFVAARDRLLAIAEADATPADALHASLSALHDVADFRWAALMGVDPETILPVSGLIEGFDSSACTPFWEAELTLPGYLKFADLARRDDPVGALSQATDGDLSRSTAYNKLYAPLGAGDELRVVFMLGASCWGIAALVRDGVDGFFTDDEMADVRQLCRFVARAMRGATLSTESRRTTRTAFVTFDSDNSPVEATGEARALLNELGSVEYLPGSDAEGPGVLRALITQARYNIAGRVVESRLRDGRGCWFRVRAARTDGATGTVAVMMEPASPADLFTMTLASYGLTGREGHIVRYLARGLSSTDIAAELSLSPHTVRDHVKAILRKCGVSSRGELVGRLFADQLGATLHGSVVRVDAG